MSVLAVALPLASPIAAITQTSLTVKQTQRPTTNTHRTAADQLAEANRLNEQGFRLLPTITPYSANDRQTVIESFQQALNLYRSPAVRQAFPQDSRNGEIKVLVRLGNVYYSSRQYQQAIAYYQQALSMSRQAGQRDGEAESLRALGSVYSELNQHQQALDYYQQALSIFKGLGDRNSEAWTLKLLGEGYDALQQYQQAIAYYQKALPIFRQVGEHNGEGFTLMDFGDAYRSLRQYQQAISYYQQAVPFFRQWNRNTEASLLATIGRLYAAQNSPQSAIQQLQQSIEIRESIMQGFPQAAHHTYANQFADDYRLLAQLLRQQNRNQEAQAVLNLLNR
jgi:tetratricopeptide (TPR) repeat protein